MAGVAAGRVDAVGGAERGQAMAAGSARGVRCGRGARRGLVMAWPPSAPRTPPPGAQLRRAGAWLGCLTIGVWLVAAEAEAARLRVQARTRLELALEQVEGRVEVQGHLRDSLGRGIPDATVVVSIRASDAEPTAAAGLGELQRGAEAIVRSGGEGAFRHAVSRLLLPAGERLLVRAAFAGDPRLSGAEASAELTPGQAPVRLRLRLHPEAPATDGETLTVEVDAAVGGVPVAGAEAALEVDGRHAALLRFDDAGSAAVALAPAHWRRPGARELRLVLPPTVQTAEATLSRTVPVALALRVQLAALGGAGGEAACADDRVCLRGEVLAWRGGPQPVPAAGAQVVLHGGGFRLGEVTTDEDGRFAAHLRHDALQARFAPGPLGLVAEAALDEPWCAPAFSAIVAVDVPPPTSPVALAYPSLLAALLLALAVRAGRRAWLRRRGIDAEVQMAAGVRLDALQPGAGHELDAVRGKVLDGEHGRPLAARVVLEAGGQTVREIQTAGGVFGLSAVPAGSYVLRVDAAGHQPLALEIQVPHDGALDGCTLLPTSLRALLRHALSRRIAQATGRALDWARETPRSAEARWLGARRRGHVASRAAVQATEIALYGPHADEVAIGVAEQALQRADEAGS